MWIFAVAAVFRAPLRDTSVAAWPVGLFAGWLGAAASVATGIVLAGYGLLDEVTAALAMVAVAIILSAWAQLKLGRAPTFGLAVIWALLGIFQVNQVDHPDIAALSIGGAMGLAALVLLALLLERRKRRLAAENA